MIDFVYNHDEQVAGFVAQLTDNHNGGNFGRCKTIGVIDEQGRLIAGLVYFNWDPRGETIEMGLASISPYWLTRATFRRIFEYPFIECGCQMVYARVRIDNERLLSGLARLNFNLTAVPRMFGRTEDGVLCTYTDDQWLDSKLSERVYRNVRRAKEAA